MYLPMSKLTKKYPNFDQLPLLTQVTDEIYKLSVEYPFAMGQTNCYLFDGEKGFTFVDTGSYAKESITIWEQTIASGIPIEKVVLTHVHPDHIGLARWFQQHHHVPVFISSLGYKEMQRIREKGHHTFMSRVFKQHGGPDIPEQMASFGTTIYQFEPDGLFENQQKIKLGNDLYETIWTPGHAPDHFCFYNHEKQVMVTGDHVLKEISPIVGVWSEEDVNPLRDYFEALERIRTLSTHFALPGHGDLIDHLKNRVDEMFSRHNHRLQQAMESVLNEEKTTGQVCQEIYGSLSLDKIFAPFMATLTRFIYLESIGKVSSRDKEGKIYYRAAN